MRFSIFAAGMAILAGCQNQKPFESGKWTTEVTMAAGKSQLWSSMIERCMEFAAGDDPVAGILSATPLGQCQQIDGQYEGQRVSVRMHCMGRPGSVIGGMPEARVHVQGRHSATTIDGDLAAELVHEKSPGSLTGKLTARRTGDCVAG